MVIKNLDKEAVLHQKRANSKKRIIKFNRREI